jgi:hypothetical protein
MAHRWLAQRAPEQSRHLKDEATQLQRHAEMQQPQRREESPTA